MNLGELLKAMERRRQELLSLRANPDADSSVNLDGQLAEVEMWLDRAGRVWA